MSDSARDVIDEFLETARLHDSVTGETFLAALSSAGFVVVPREPTEKMVTAHPIALGLPVDLVKNRRREVYRAMLSAADGKE